MPDIDIDFYDREKALKLFKHIPASIIKDNNAEKHKTGIYFHDAPVNILKGFCSLDYKKAEDRKYFKIDCLNVSVYEKIESEEHLVKLMLKEPDWNMLLDVNIVNQLFHLNGHFEIVSKLEPKNIEQLAAVLAIIRPAKRGLMYKDWTKILEEVWQRPTDGSYFFKKSHAIAYAQLIVVQMNLLSDDKYIFDETSKKEN